MSVLNERSAQDIARAVFDMLTDEGYEVEEIIPGMIQTIILAADGDDALLDSAANLLADGGV